MSEMGQFAEMGHCLELSWIMREGLIFKSGIEQ